ncbi:MAG: hypothetical protein ACE5FD_02020 [Anaerolineae bacterium]
MTKKQLGLGFITLGILAILGLMGMDVVGASNFQGIGPTQRLALIGAGAMILVGASLVPLGDRPA